MLFILYRYENEQNVKILLKQNQQNVIHCYLAKIISNNIFEVMDSIKEKNQ